MSLILSSTENAVCTITLNRPDKLNAMFGTMREDLLRELESARDDSRVRAVIITGAGRGFCAGGDVEYMSGLQKEQNTAAFMKLLDAGRDIVITIREMPKFVVAAVNGIAAGAGCNLALAADYRIAAETAKFGETFVKIGLHPDWGGTYFLPRLVGPGKAMELLSTGRIIESAEALAIGMVDRVVPSDRLLEEANGLARMIASGPPIPLGDIKRAVYASPASTLRQQLDREGENQLRAFASSDSAEGMAAFFEKRGATFRGE